jgi:hypothetical protein
VRGTDAAAAAILADRFDLSGYDAFIARHLTGSDGRAGRRFVEHFLDPRFERRFSARGPTRR